MKKDQSPEGTEKTVSDSESIFNCCFFFSSFPTFPFLVKSIIKFGDYKANMNCLRNINKANIYTFIT